MHLEYILDTDNKAFSQCDITFESGNDLYDAVYISILSFARASEDAGMQYGWWFDSLTGFKTGCKLWTLRRVKNINQTKNVETFLKESLNWLIEDGIALVVNVKAFEDFDRIDALVTIQKHNGEVINLKFNDLWAKIYE